MILINHKYFSNIEQLVKTIYGNIPNMNKTQGKV